MAALNKWLGLGRLTADPQRVPSTSSNVVATFVMAINERWKGDGASQAIQSTTFVPVIASGGLAEAILTHLTKGREVLVEGKLQIDSSIVCNEGRHARTSIRAENVQFLNPPHAASKEASGLPGLQRDS